MNLLTALAVFALIWAAASIATAALLITWIKHLKRAPHADQD